MDLDDHTWCAYFTGLMIYISMRIDVDHAASRFALAFDFIAASSQCSLATLHRTGVFRHIGDVAAVLAAIKEAVVGGELDNAISAVISTRKVTKTRSVK